MKSYKPFSQVAPIAKLVKGALESYCERIEIAGSIRREEPQIGDIEIVCVPRAQPDLFGGRSEYTELDAHLARLLSANKIDYALDSRGRRRWGPKQKAIEFTSSIGEVYAVELYIQPDPATWGVNFLLRTGPAAFSQRVVTPRAKGGSCPDGFEFREGRLYYVDFLLETPEEIDVLDALELGWIEPKERR